MCTYERARPFGPLASLVVRRSVLSTYLTLEFFSVFRRRHTSFAPQPSQPNDRHSCRETRCLQVRRLRVRLTISAHRGCRASNFARLRLCARKCCPKHERLAMQPEQRTSNAPQVAIQLTHPACMADRPRVRAGRTFSVAWACRGVFREFNDCLKLQCARSPLPPCICVRDGGALACAGQRMPSSRNA